MPSATSSGPIATRSFPLDKDAMLTFFGRNNFLSSFYPAPFIISGNTYPTVEHYYEACKLRSLCGAECARSLKSINDPGAAKATSKRFTQAIPRKHKEMWRRSDGILVVRYALGEKYRQNPHLAEQLLATGEKLLVQSTKYDDLWSTGMLDKELDEWLAENAGNCVDVPSDVFPENVEQLPTIGKGKNLLGVLTMSIRDQLRREQASAAQAASYGTVPMESS